MVASRAESPSTSPDAESRVVVVDDEHIEALARFHRQVWDSGTTVDAVRAARARNASSNPLAPGENAPVLLFMKGEEAIGHLGTIPVQLLSDGEVRAAHWLHALWVLPEHRNGPIGFLMLREAIERLGTLMAVAVQEAPRRLYEALGFTILGPVPNYVKLIRPSRVMRSVPVRELGLVSLPEFSYRWVDIAQRVGVASLAGKALGGALRLKGAITGRAPRGGRRVDALPPAAELDELWGQAARGLGAAVVRDGRYLISRYPCAGDDSYAAIVLGDRGLVEGLAIVRRPGRSSDPRLGGVSVAVLADLIVPPDRTDLVLAALRAAEDVAAGLGADALLCTASDARLARLLRRRAFLGLPGNQRFFFRTPEGQGGLPAHLGRWWITRGDSRADAAF